MLLAISFEVTVQTRAPNSQDLRGAQPVSVQDYHYYQHDFLL
jgi:hypothetical protein